MKAWLFVLTTAMFVSNFSTTIWSVESRGASNPAGYGTIPPSTYHSGLVNTPNPIDPTGNLLITGNVRRGMHFRGSVPYRSTTSFSGTLGSSALNSFLRDTAGSEDFGNRSNKYRVQPFYSPTQTVTTMIPGRSEVFRPMGMRIDHRARQGASIVSNGLLGLDSLPQAQASLDQDTAAGGSDLQKLQTSYPSFPPRMKEIQQVLYAERSRGTSYLESLVPGQLGIRQHRKASPKGENDMSSDRSQDRIRDANRMRQDLATDSEQHSDSDIVDPQRQQNLTRDVLIRRPGEQESFEELKSRLGMRKPVGSAEAEPAKGGFTGSSGDIQDRSTQSTTLTRSNDFLSESQDQRDVLEQIRKQIEALTKSVESGLKEDGSGIGSSEYLLQHRKSLSTSKDAIVPSHTSNLYPLPQLDSHLSPADKGPGQVPLKSPAGSSEVGILSTVSSLDELEQYKGSSFSTNAERIKAPYENLESFSKSRFNQHITAAEDHLKAGRYYRAVDSFTLASVYQPSDPVVLAGKGHALFAAGDYMSSALFIARTLELQPDYIQEKVDLAAMLSGAEILAKRITDVEQWLARSGSAQLQFLLSYVSFRTGKLNQAKQAIAAAYEKMPNSPAVIALRTAINQATR